MASGRLGKARLAADTDTVIYTVPASTLATVNVNCVNTGTAAATVKIAIATTDVPADGDYFELSALAATGGVVERTAIMLSAGERVIVKATTDAVDVRVHGIEEAA